MMCFPVIFNFILMHLLEEYCSYFRIFPSRGQVILRTYHYFAEDGNYDQSVATL